MHHEDRFTAGDGLSLYQQCWLPEGPAGAAVVLLHGFTEHSGRYARLAEELNGQGYAVYAMDLRGHGKSQGPRCWVRSFDQYVDDFDLFWERVGRQEPQRPRFVLGHCLGGTIALKWAIRGGQGGQSHFSGLRPKKSGQSPGPADVAGLVLSAAALKIGQDVFPRLRRLAWLAGRLLPRLRVLRFGSRGISRDPAVVEDFRSDPLVFHGRFPVRTASEVLAAMRFIDARMELLGVPLLILHGTADRACDVEGSRRLYQRAGSSDKTLRLYEGLYHAIFSEPERGQVLADLSAWLACHRAGCCPRGPG